MRPWKKTRSIGVVLAAVLVTACAGVPRESVELSNTVGQDLEAIHRAHIELAELHFARQIERANRFIDETYRPAFIEEFAGEFRLSEEVERVVERDPDKLLPVLTRFVTIATQRVERERARVVDPIAAQRDAVLAEIDASYRQVRAAHAVVTGHLASVRKVREVQNEILAEVGLEGMPQRIARATAGISSDISELIARGEAAEARLADAGERVRAIRDSIDRFRDEHTDADQQGE